MENINNLKKRKVDDNSNNFSMKKQNITKKLDIYNDNEDTEPFDIEILDIPLEENNSKDCIDEDNESKDIEPFLNDENYDLEDFLVEPDESDDINDYKYGDFMKHIEESDYTANYKENEDGDYEY